MIKFSQFLKEESILDNPNFKAWFGKSKSVDNKGTFSKTSKNIYENEKA